MSEIPLHSIRRNKARAGYIPLNNDEESSSNSPEMRKAASSSSGPRRNLKLGGNRAKDRYVDDPEEAAGLLGSSYDTESGFDDESQLGSARPESAKPSVRFPSWYLN